MENKGFKKGKIPERFEGKTDEQLAVMQHIMWNSGKTVFEEIEGKITTHLTHYFDDELAAVQIIKKIERLEKALDKACDMLRLFESGYAESEPAYALISSTLDGVECHDIKWWKEWCMSDEHD